MKQYCIKNSILHHIHLSDRFKRADISMKWKPTAIHQKAEIGFTFHMAVWRLNCTAPERTAAV
jgi:hypothetical protein